MNENQEADNFLPSWKNRVPKSNDFWASIVVFLVAVPLCIGIALASGVSPILGLVTGIIGGLVVGSISGAPLLVSGPAAGLTVLVWDLVQDLGVQLLGPIILLAGLIQILSAAFHLGQWFRAVSPAVIHGMLAGIGVLIFASQFHVMLDDKPHGSGIQNLISIPKSIFEGLVDLNHGLSQHHLAAWVGAVTILTVILWNRYKPHRLRTLPAPLMGVISGSLVASLFGLEIDRIEIPPNIFSAIQLTTPAFIVSHWSWKILGEAIAIAFIASTETLLSATAVDQMHSGPRTRYEKELLAQGIGNFICGVLGSLPMTGVIVRSTVNVQTGAKTRASTILHGLWILIFVAAFPKVLTLIPTSALAAILVHTGYHLVNLAIIRKLKEHGRAEVLVYLATLMVIVTTDLLTGVITGLVLAVLKTLISLSSLDVSTEFDPSTNSARLHLTGALTFYRVPKLVGILNQIPPQYSLELDVTNLIYIDHACLEVLANWEKQGRSLHIRGRELPGFKFKKAG